jgi:CRISPR-associated protein Cmr5
MSVSTRSQKLAQAAYARITKRASLNKEYVSFAKKFPALIHTCGFAQAVASALTKEEARYIDDLAAVLKDSGHPEITTVQALGDQARTQQLSHYLRISRDASQAASWLKRYVEAVAGEEQ